MRSTRDELGSGSGTVTIELMNRSEQQVAPEAAWFRANVSDASMNAEPFARGL
jgi:precorrin-6B methylase 2